MSNELQGAINVLVSRVEQKTQELAEIKRMINSLCREASQSPLYSDADLAVKGAAGLPSLDSDQFYGKTPTVAAREYLELRDKAVSLDEILDALERGGFDFAAQKWNTGARLKNLGISLGKNSLIFHRLPSNTWGLTKWYPGVKGKKNANKDNGKLESAEEEIADEKAETASAK
jgi:hypothetical protein